MGERKQPYQENGKRYAKCVKCGKRWNIAVGQIVMSSGYVCPDCGKRKVKK